MFIIVLCCFIGIFLASAPKDLSVDATNADFAYVTNSNLRGENSFGYDSESGLTTNFDLEQCSLYGAKKVGLILNGAEDQEKKVLYDILADINQAYKEFNTDNADIQLTAQEFDNNEMVDEYVQNQDYISEGMLCMSYGFDKFDTETHSYDFTQRFYATWIPSTNMNQVVPSTILYDELGYQKYNSTVGYNQLMATATKHIIAVEGENVDDFEFSLAFLPMNTGPDFKGSLFALAFCPVLISFVTDYTRILPGKITQASDEKNEVQILWMLRQMGLKASVEILLRTKIFLTIGVITALIITSYLHYIVLSAGGILYIFLYIFISMVNNWMLTIVLQYSLGRVTGILVSILLAVAQLLIILVFQSLGVTLGLGTYLMALLPAGAFYANSTMILIAGNLQQKVNLSTLTTAIEGVYPGYVILTQLASSLVIFLILLWSWPRSIDFDPENPLPWYYPCTCSYWKGRSKKPSATFEDDHQVIQIEPLLEGDHEVNPNSFSYLLPQENQLIQDGNLEKPQDRNFNPSKQDIVQVDGLSKIYGQKTAVDKFSLTMFKNEILVLLGHNGAGKTTTLSMLTGRATPTSGKAQAFGRDLLGDVSNLLDFIGVCPQDNVLLEKLTSYDNLEFFAKFKGIQEDQISQIVNENLDKFNLAHKSSTAVADLSGGQKRKLQLAISLMGNSQFVLLDEPTSGMDPTARRETWEIIKKSKKDRLIILTTHYMDEAEYLADRVAIMSGGELKCCGSSLFLKNKYGTGFILQIEKRDNNQDLQDLDKLINELTRENPQAINVKTNESGNTVYELPKSISPKFSELFQIIDGDLASFNIKQYDLRVSSLEEVFMEIGKQEEAAALSSELHEINQSLSVSVSQSESESEDFFLKPEKRTFWSSCSASSSIACNMQTGNGIASLCCVFFVMVLALSSVVISSVYVKEPQIDYSDPTLFFTDGFAEFGSPLKIGYNEKTVTDGETNLFFDGLFTNELKQGFEKTPIKPQYSQAQSDVENMQNFANSLEQTAFSGEMFYGSYALFDMDLTVGQKSVDLAIYSNMTSSGAAPLFGAQALEQIARSFTGKDTTIKFKNFPLPQNANFTISTTPQLAIQLLILCFFVLGAKLYGSISSQQDLHEKGFIFALMSRGTTPGAYVLGHIPVQSLWYLLIGFVMYGCMSFAGINLEKFYIPILLFAITEPIFQHWFIEIMQRRSCCNQNQAKQTLGGLLVIAYFLGTSFISQTVNPDAPQYLGLMGGYAFCFLPYSNFLYSIITIMLRNQNAVRASIKNNEEFTSQEISPLGPNGCQFFLIAQIVCLFVYSVWLCLGLHGKNTSCQKLSPRVSPILLENEDADVKRERQRICDPKNQLENDLDILTVQNLTKKYQTKQKDPDQDQNDRPQEFDPQETEEESEARHSRDQGMTAISGISFGVSKGEVFTLLGINGAGKSSTFKCLVGLQDTSNGQIMLSHIDQAQIINRPWLLHDTVGYCPQTDCILNNMSVKDHLSLFAKIVGFSQNLIPQVVNRYLNKFALKQFSDTKAGNLSGGNKRKLCCAMAMIGNPKVVFIDEATTGVDPASRRVIWRGIKSEGKDSAVVYTTHAMEEAEEISSKLTVMVKGSFRCFGSLQDIKRKFGQGFEIKFTLDTDQLNDGILERDQTERRELKTQEQICNVLQNWVQEFQDARVRCGLDLVKEFSQNGLLKRQYLEFKAQGKLSSNDLQKTVLIQNGISNIMQKLSEKVSDCQLVTYEGNFAHIKTIKSADQPSIGYVFGQMEQLKMEFPILEYSCNQATLDQIFNSFATEQEFMYFNRSVSKHFKSSQGSKGDFANSNYSKGSSLNQLDQDSFASVDQSMDESKLFENQ